MTTTLIAPRIFVTALSAAVSGQWFDLEEYDDAEELTQAIADNLQASAGEYIVTDFEGFPALLYSERMNLQALYTYLDVVDQYNTYPPKEWFEALMVYFRVKGIAQPTETTVQDFDNAYQGSYKGENPKRNFASHLINVLADGSCDPEAIKRHMNIDTFQKELFSGEYWEGEGHIFC